MELINEYLQELIETSNQYNSNQIDIEERNLKLDLLLHRLELIQIEYSITPFNVLSERIQDTFNQLLFRSRHRSITSIESLIATTDKRSFNATVRRILASKLYFSTIHSTMQRQIVGYL
jgi:hypothetical protein